MIHAGPIRPQHDRMRDVDPNARQTKQNKMKKLFADRTIENNPRVVGDFERKELNKTTGEMETVIDKYSVGEISGEYFRVMPTSGKEVLFLQSLPRSKRHAPASGHGVIVAASAINGI